MKWIELNSKALKNNISKIKKLVKAQHISIVLKANAYGHGLKEIASICENIEEVNSYCVFSLSEALILRCSSIKKPILVFGDIDDQIEKAIKDNITLTVYDVSIAKCINQAAKKLNKIAKVHIKIDTGLSRLGFVYNNKEDINAQAINDIIHISKFQNLELEGIYSHLSEADLEDDSFTNHQIESFSNILIDLQKHSINFKLTHMFNSSGTIKFAHTPKFNTFNMVRIGGAAYGYIKPYIKENINKFIESNLELEQVLKWKANFIQIKTVENGSYISYARTHRVKRKTKIGIVPVGYSDGFDRKFSNNGHVLIKNIPAPILGRIAMNAFMVDITDLDIEPKDHIVLMDETLTPDLLASKLDTITYEFLTKINRDIRRIII